MSSVCSFLCNRPACQMAGLCTGCPWLDMMRRPSVHSPFFLASGGWAISLGGGEVCDDFTARVLSCTRSFCALWSPLVVQYRQCHLQLVWVRRSGEGSSASQNMEAEGPGPRSSQALPVVMLPLCGLTSCLGRFVPCRWSCFALYGLSRALGLFESIHNNWGSKRSAAFARGVKFK